MPYSSAVCDAKAIGRRGRTPATAKARPSASVTATPLASSKAPPNQPSWWPATTLGAPPRRPPSTPTTFAASAPRVSGASSTTRTRSPARRRLGDAAERRALVPPPAGLDVRVEQPPRVDRDGLLDHLEPHVTQLSRDERHRRPLLRRPRHAETERVRAETLQPLDHGTK